MPSGKNNNVVRNKPLKLNAPSEKQHVPSTSATAVCMNKKKPSGESVKTKPHILRSAKR
jgi:hypothetical protein